MRLKRWEDQSGSSAGYWMVPQVHGLSLCKKQAGWQFVAGNAFANMTRSMSFHDFWGYQDAGLDAYLLLSRHRHLKRTFAYRAEAIAALEGCLTECAGTGESIGQALIS